MPPKIDAGMDPIMAKHREQMQAIMDALTDVLPGVGMCLFVFDPHAGQPRANYISNTERTHTLAAIKEWVKRQEAING